jgi:LAO/AO transport system kinase
MEMADTIVINKADGDNIRKAQLAKSEFNRGLHLFPAKNQAGFLQLQLAVQLHKTDSRKPSRNLSNSRKAMIILMKTLGTERILDEAINEQLKGNFITIPKYKTCWNQLKAVQNGEISPFAAAQLLWKSTLKINLVAMSSRFTLIYNVH